jgi:NAD(P)-dependent dehydrogenase (short-subunit alcohol dehydrogenase family)
MSLELFKLRGKVAMVTGSTRGLGETAAKALAKAGADVAICGRNRNDLDRVSSAIKELGRDSAGFFLDVTSKKSILDGVDGIMNHFGKVDILVNNAGVNHRVPALEFPEEAWNRIINTNLKGYFLVAQAVVPQMLERGYGKVINMSSILGSAALPNQLAYASSKGGVDQMTKVMALEFELRNRRTRNRRILQFEIPCSSFIIQIFSTFTNPLCLPGIWQSSFWIQDHIGSECRSFPLPGTLHHEPRHIEPNLPLPNS